MIKAVIFDVGGTLLGATDLFENIVALSTSTVVHHDDIYRFVANDFFRQVADCRNGLPFMKVEEMIDRTIFAVNQEFNNCLSSVDAARVYWRTFVDDSFVINDANLALEALIDQKIALLIASDADAELIYAQFQKHKWTNYFRKCFISSELKAYKPNDVFVAALKDGICNYEKNEVIFVGDSDVDIQTGRKLGVKTALINKSNEKRYDEDYSIGSLLELLDLSAA